jgi:hypothetical protein
MLRANAFLWRALRFASLCTLLCATHAFANGTGTFADFDGDGRRDRVSLDATEPSIVRIWLSATKSTQIIRSSQPLLAITAVDLNGDRRSELVATTRSPGLHIWTKAHKGFRTYVRKRPPSRGFGRQDRRTVDDEEDDAGPAAGASKPVLTPIATSVHRRGPPDDVRVDAREPIFTVRSATPLTPSSPRPPPLL